MFLLKLCYVNLSTSRNCLWGADTNPNSLLYKTSPHHSPLKNLPSGISEGDSIKVDVVLGSILLCSVVLSCALLSCVVLGYIVVLCCIRLSSVVLGCTLSSVVRSCTRLYSVVFCCPLLYSAVLYCTRLSSVVLGSPLLYSVVLCCTLLYSVVLCCTGPGDRRQLARRSRSGDPVIPDVSGGSAVEGQRSGDPPTGLDGRSGNGHRSSCRNAT